MKTEVRRATPDDATRMAGLCQTVQAWHAATYPDRFNQKIDPDALRHHFAGLMAQEDTPGWVAIANTKTLGYLTAAAQRRPENLFRPANARLMIQQIGVDPAMRRSGAGAALMAAARDFAQTEGLSTVTLTTYAANTDALFLCGSRL